MKNQRGITLIALLITIIVLLILAGVSIAMLTGENGILNKATSARSETNKAEAVERINLALNAVKAEIFDQQVDTQSWEPLTGSASSYGLQGAVTDSLKLDGFETAAASITTATSGVYSYYLDKSTGVLTLMYWNGTTEVGTQAAPIKGQIDLKETPSDDDASKYEVTKAPM